MNRPHRLGVLAAVAGCLALAAATGARGFTAVPAAAAGADQAVVVIDTGGLVRSTTISFSGSVTGIQALQLAGANPTTYGYAGQGLAVCSLDGVGHTASEDDCLGTSGDPRYWAYFRAPSGSTAWSYSRGGAGGVTVRDGDVEGWRFGGGAAPRVGVCEAKSCAPPAPPPTDPPPPTPAAPSGAGGSASSSGGSANPPPTTATADPSPGATTTTGAPTPGTTADASTRPGTGGGGDGDRTSAAPRVAGDDSGSGSPLGVILAVLVVAAIGGAAVVLRRRGRAPG